MKNLKIYYISERYINYLRKFDRNVAFNKNTTALFIHITITITLRHFHHRNQNIKILIRKQLIFLRLKMEN